MRRGLIVLVLLGGCRTHLPPVVEPPPVPIKRVVVPLDALGHWDMCVEVSEFGLYRLLCPETVDQLRDRYTRLLDAK